MLRRWVVALGMLGLVCAVALPAANAAVLIKEDFSTDNLLKDEKTYVQGRGLLIRGDDTIPPFMVRDGVLTSSPEGSTSGSDDVGIEDPDLPGIRYLLLFGEPTWADVSIQTRVMVENQGTGSFGLLLRAASKTKLEDPDSWYELRYTTGLPPGPLPDEADDGIETNQDPPSLRLMKVVNGKWTMLAEMDASGEKEIPNISNSGDLAGEFITVRFTAKGNVLQGLISTNGETFEKFIEATDDELKTGRVGLAHFEYNPIFDDLLVEDTP